jgi:integrase/recombinase XerC
VRGLRINSLMDIHPLVNQFLASLTNASPHTVATYKSALHKFLESRIPIDNSVLSAFDQWLTTAHFDYGARSGNYSTAARYLYVSALKRFLEWMEVSDLLPGFNWGRAQAKLHIGRGRAKAVVFKPRMPDPQLPLIVAYADAHTITLDDWRNRAFVHLLYDSGCRLAEALSLTRKDVNDGKLVEVWVTGKGGKGRWLFLSAVACSAIADYCERRYDAQPPLFICHRTYGRMNRTSAYMMVKRMAAACGLTGNTSPHSFRHHFATRLLNNGMPIESVQQLLGHSSIETTRRYYAHTMIQTLREHVARFRDGAA